jgi:hypothetical protein
LVPAMTVRRTTALIRKNVSSGHRMTEMLRGSGALFAPTGDDALTHYRPYFLRYSE